MVRVDDQANTSSESENSNYVRLAGRDGLPGGEQQVVSSPEVSLAPSDENSSGRAPQLALPSSSSTATSSTQNSLIPVDENGHRYVGLVNQAMTCYLNSLVQSLYMTPEFRNAMYEWEYVQSVHAKEQKKKADQSIPCQLQKLFLLLQTTDNDSLETKDLTQSFGWTSNEAYDQHDVQELCRLMFDALEHKWKGTKHEKLIQDLYRGTMEDFVACQKCGRESVKTDYFLDLPLAVKPFGAMHAYKSVEEALEAFIQPELLDGSNQYMCENCKSKQDAHKGLRITQFPYLLTIQLKRFDFDYNTMHRIKLNDKMTFPDVLDLNEYVNKEKKSSATAGQPIPGAPSADDDDLDLGSPNPKRYTLDQNATPSPNRYSSRGEDVIIGQPIDHDAVEQLTKTSGDNLYELFSVMVHSGNAAGGHYFAYIKNLDQDRWYIFNDTRVDFASSEEIEKSFGGHPSGWNQSNTNAYMLMYRRIDPKRNVNFILTSKLPRHIKDSQEKWRIQELEAEEERLRKLSLIQVYVNINYPFPSYVKLKDGKSLDLTPSKYQIADDFCEYKTEISREMPIKQVFNHAFEFFNERARAYNLHIVKNNSRLIYVEHGCLKTDFKSPSDMDKKLRSVFSSHLPEPGSMYGVNFILDVRIGSMFFPLDYGYGGMTIKVQRVDIGKRTTANELTMVVFGDEKMLKVRSWIGQQFRDDIHAVCQARLVLESAASRCEFMLIDALQNGYEFRSLVSQHLGQSVPTLYYDGGIDRMVTEDSKQATLKDRLEPFEKSVMFQILDRKCFSTFVKVRLPSQEEIDKAASAKNAYQGPSWAETMANAREEDRVWNEPRAAVEVMSTVSKIESDLAGDVDDEPIASGRVSTASMRSISVDDIDPGEIVSGSFCNNTPQMSPCVSEGDDSDQKESLAGKLQMMDDYVHNKPAEFQNYYQSFPSSHSLNKNLKVSIGDDAVSESAVSSGQSTLVPSTSSQALSNMARSSDEALDGKIVTVYANENFYKLDVDSRMKVSEFKKWVAERLEMDKNQFVIVKHAADDGSDNGYETNFADDETIACAFQSCYISIKLRAPLKSDEKMTQIVLFDMLENQRENWKTLFELPISPNTVVGDILLQCIRLYKEIYGEELSPKQLRLRELTTGTPNTSGRTLYNPNDTIGKRPHNWNSHLYLQIITDEAAIGKPGEPIMVRRFRPSTAEVSATHEVLVDGNVDSPVESFLEAVSAYSGIPADRLAVIDPKDYSWSKWPFQKSRIDMLDQKIHFTKDLNLAYAHSKDFIEKVGSRVLYYKDADEEAKILTEDERKQIKIKENGQTANANRRKERPLRIQMSSVSEA